MMYDIFARAEKYAKTVTVREAGEEKQVKAFIQACSTENPDYETRPTAMGLEDDRRYLILAERRAFSPRGKVEIQYGEQVFELLRRELLWDGSHWEGLMRLKGGGEDAG